MRAPLLLLFLLPAFADTEFTAKQMLHDAPHGKGQCDIRLLGSGTVEVTVQGDRVRLHTVAGKGAHDDGSECNAPMPNHEFGGFQFSPKEKRGEMRVNAEPTKNNGYSAVVFIEAGGIEARNSFRLNWIMPSPAPPRTMSFNNTLHSTGKGGGWARLNDGQQLSLTGATVDADRGNKIFVVITLSGGTSAGFSGSVMSFEGGVMKADITADDRFNGLRGPMHLYFDGQNELYKIDMEATDGQERFAMRWDRSAPVKKKKG